MKALLSVLFFLLVLKSVYGAWTLEVEFRNITVLQNVMYDETNDIYCCCDTCDDQPTEYCFLDLLSNNCTVSGACRCDPLVTTCLDYGGDNMRDCVITDNVARSGTKFNIFQSVSTGVEIYTQLHFAGNNYPTNGSVGLFIMIEERDSNTDIYPMDILQVERTLFETGYIIKTYTSNKEIIQLAIGTYLNCATDYYGDDCDTYCRLTDDDTGHYACYSSGEKACLSGYMNPETNCTEPFTIQDTGTTTQQTVTPTQQVDQTQVDSSCTPWRISLAALVLVIAFILGVCCTSACLLVFLRKRKNKLSSDRRTKNGVGSLNINDDQSGGVCNPLYGDKSKIAFQDEKLKGYEVMLSSTVNNVEARTNSKNNDYSDSQDLEYETIDHNEQGRRNFSKLGTPKLTKDAASAVRGDIIHSYETVSLDEENEKIDNDTNKQEEYSTLSHHNNN